LGAPRRNQAAQPPQQRLGGMVGGTAGIMVLYPLLRWLRRLGPARGAESGTRGGAVACGAGGRGTDGPVAGAVDGVDPSALDPSTLAKQRLGGSAAGGAGWQVGQK